MQSFDLPSLKPVGRMIECGGLAGTVRSDQGPNRTVPDFKTDIVGVPECHRNAWSIRPLPAAGESGRRSSTQPLTSKARRRGRIRPAVARSSSAPSAPREGQTPGSRRRRSSNSGRMVHTSPPRSPRSSNRVRPAPRWRRSTPVKKLNDMGLMKPWYVAKNTPAMPPPWRPS